MECRGCGHENRARAKFCDGCGASLAAVCPSCRTELRPGARFCDECGAAVAGAPASAASAPSSRAERSPSDYTPRHLADKILQSKSALEGERKRVTVLFADVKGSMELAGGLDPEEWHGILDRFFEILTEGVHRFEGTVNQYTGDGIMALFGAPIAHEDHAQRACYAALHLQKALKAHADALRVDRGLNFSVRMGLNSGEVVVGSIGDDLRMDYTAQGQTVGLAQRMESLAEPGKTLLSGETIDLVDGYFALRDLGETKVKGVATPVRVAELEGVGRMRTRLDRSRARGLSKFVGRDDELARFEAALERALAGDGQVLGIVAEAGSGKSRLCHEFAERCRARGILVRTGTGVPHGRATPLEPILEFYREIFGIEPDDRDDQARQKIAGAVAQLAPEELDALPLLYEFMRVPDPARPAPEQRDDERRRAIMDLLRRMTTARSRREPAVLVFEDLHWLDPETDELIEGLVDAASGTRTLCIVNFRPEYRADWMGRTHYQQIALRPLDAEAAGELLADWLGRHPSLDGFAERVRDRTGGNPFFMEEVVQAYIESGALVGARGHFRLEADVQSLEVPRSVQSLLAARIDRLDEATKRLLQTAAVIGGDCPEPLLSRMTELEPDALRAALRALVQSEFLYEASLYPELEYAFKHPLTREVAYGSLLRERRRELHRRAAEALEALAGEDADARAALLAHHWEEAGSAVEAARWRVRAADLLGGSHPRESLFHWRKAAELVASETSDDARRLRGRARARMLYAASRSALPHAEVDALFEAARRDLGDVDSPELATTLSLYGVARSGAGSPREGHALSCEALEMARRLESPALEAGMRAMLLIVRNAMEWPEETLLHASRIERLCADDSAHGTDLVGGRPLVFARAMGTIALQRMGRADEVEPAHARLRALVADSAVPVEQGVAHYVAVQVHAARGDVDAALEAGRQALEWSQRSSNDAQLATGHLARAHGLQVAGRLDDAIHHLREACRLAIEQGVSRPNACRILPSLSRLHREKGEIAEAIDAADRGVALTSGMGMPRGEAESHVARVHALAVSDRDDALHEAEASFERACALMDEHALPALTAEIEAARAALASLRGDAAGREAALREAARLYREVGERRLAARVEAELAG